MDRNRQRIRDFGAYKIQIAEFNEAYDKMNGIKNKPDFIEVCHRVNNIICDFELQRKGKVCNEKKSR
jgi:hypothetical protein